MEKVCLLGCGITTGFGAATKTANVTEGSSVAVFGIGCVGLAVIQGCAARKCGSIVAIDVNNDKKAWATKMGAHQFVNPTDVEAAKKDIKQVLTTEFSDGGFDYTLLSSFVLRSACHVLQLILATYLRYGSDCTGNVNVMRTALEVCHKGT